MTDAEWLASDDPAAMRQHLRSGYTGIVHGASERKLRLFAVACCRQIWHLLTDERSRNAVEWSERYADGLATKKQVAATYASASEILRIRDPQNDGPERGAAWAAIWSSGTEVDIPRGLESFRDAGLALATQAVLLREIVGNPYRPVTFDAANCWSYDVMRLSQVAYRDRDFEMLPILADALEDAGCEEEALLRHLRGEEYIGSDDGTWRICEECDHPFLWPLANPEGRVRCPKCGSDRYRKARWYIPNRGPHVRGCWALDLLLGKE